jgi:5-(carboxyamino)imidazole ribonucleotide mutase
VQITFQMRAPSRLLPSMTVPQGQDGNCPVSLTAFEAGGMDALVATAEVLAQFEILAEPTLLSMPLGETPDFTAFGRRAAQKGIRIVIAATREKRFARGLSLACQVPTIRIPLAAEASVEAGLAALMEGEGVHDAAVDSGSFATVALGEAGARNAALLAVAILALRDERLSAAWRAFRERQTQAVLSQPPLRG